jgi:hypothetical protein
MWKPELLGLPLREIMVEILANCGLLIVIWCDTWLGDYIIGLPRKSGQKSEYYCEWIYQVHSWLMITGKCSLNELPQLAILKSTGSCQSSIRKALCVQDGCLHTIISWKLQGNCHISTVLFWILESLTCSFTKQTPLKSHSSKAVSLERVFRFNCLQLTTWENP